MKFQGGNWRQTCSSSVSLASPQVRELQTHSLTLCFGGERRAAGRAWGCFLGAECQSNIFQGIVFWPPTLDSQRLWRKICKTKMEERQARKKHRTNILQVLYGLNYAHPPHSNTAKFRILSLAPVPQNVAVFKKGVFKEAIKVKWGPMGGSESSVTGVLMRSVLIRRIWTDTQREGHMKTREKTPSTSQGERPNTDHSLTALKRKQPHWLPHFRLLASKRVRK